MIENIFSTPLLRTKMNLNINDLLNTCYEIADKEEGAQNSNVGGYQSQPIRAEYPVLNELCYVVTEQANFFSKYLGLRKIELSNFWININKYKDYNSIHDHPGCLVSGVFYIKTPTDCGKILFRHPSPTMRYFLNEQDFTEKNLINSELINYSPEEGALFLFPSWIEHQVSANLSNEDRVSLAFNFL